MSLLRVADFREGRGFNWMESVRKRSVVAAAEADGLLMGNSRDNQARRVGNSR